MELTFENINSLPSSRAKLINREEFEKLLDSVPVSERLGTWTKIKPAALQYLSQEAHEALLNRLPQCGTIKDRQAGALRVLSLGFHVHVAGTDPRCTYQPDFFVRINGYRGVTNLLIQPRAYRFDPAMLAGLNVGPKADCFEILQHLAARYQLRYLHHYELVVLRMYRPGCPNSYQWSTVGGVLEEEEEHGGAAAIRARACLETREEVRGYEIYGWAPLACNLCYQAGNLAELQHLGVTLGLMSNRQLVQLNTAEGITELHTVLLDHAQGFFEKLRGVPPHRSDCIVPDGKLCHGLEILLPKLQSIGIVKK